MKATIVVVVSVLLMIGIYGMSRIGGTVTPEPGHDPGPAISSPQQQKLKQYTVLLDVSASRPPRMVDEGKRYVSSLIDRMNYGDRLFLLQIYEHSVNDPEPSLDVTLRKSDEITPLEADDALRTQRAMLRSKVSEFFQGALERSTPQTDILTTLSIASEQISPANQNILVVLSDMFQSSKEFEFEGLKRMPPKGWIEAQNKEHLVRPLQRACVVVVGADPSTNAGRQVFTFWQEYFAASGATLTAEDYRTTPPPANAMPCE